MEPVSTTALIGAGISALSAGGTAAATGAQNRKSRAFSREMYEKTKQDNIQFWNMQNEYNSPQAQMARLKGAGLNPNMLYDKTGAVIPAQNINTPDVQSAQFRTPDFGSVGSGLVQGYFDTKIKQAQYDNLRVANTVSQQEAILKAAQAAGEVKRTEGQGYLNSVAASNVDALIRRAGLENEKLQADIAFTLNQDQRAAISNTQSVAESVQRVKNMAIQNINDAATLKLINQNYQNLIKDGTLKQLDIELKRTGVQPTDELWQRAIGRIMSDLIPTGSLPGLGKSIMEWGKEKFKSWNPNYPGGSW
jgi:hypothetical protein